MTDIIRTPAGILCYPALFTPRAPAEGAEPRFSLVIAYSKEQVANDPAFKTLKQAIAACARERWGDKLPANLRNPLRPTSEKDAEPFASLEGGLFLSAWSKKRPGVVGPGLEEILDPDDVWAGQQVRITCRPFAYDTSGNRGVSLGLNNVQIVDRDGERMDGRRPARTDFDALETATADSDDDIPF